MSAVGGIVPQRSLPGRQGAVTWEMLSSWLSKLGAGVSLDMSGGAQTIPDNTPTLVSWETLVHDTHGFWTSTAPTVVTIPKGLDGVYIVGGAVRWVGNSAGYREQTIVGSGVSGMPDSTTDKPTRFVPGTNAVRMYPLVTRRMYLAAGDQVSVEVEQNCGVGLDIPAVDDSFFHITRVGDLPREARVL